MWALTASVNDYDQYGEYLVAVFEAKPGYSDLLALNVLGEKTMSNLLDTENK